MAAEMAVTFLLAYGGTQLYIADDPKGRTSHEALIGYDAAKRRAAMSHRLQRRVPLAKRWLAQMLAWQGHSRAQIARTLRVSDVSVGGWLAPKKEG